MKRAVAACAAFAALAGVPAAARKPRETVPYTQLAQVPSDARAVQNPLATDPGAKSAGAKLYARHCGDCHGEGGENGRKGPSLLAPEVQDASDGMLFWVISHGNVRAGMPVWTKLPEPQRWQITAYVKSLKVADAPRR